MLPVLSREVVEGKQRVAILDQALDSLVVFDAPGFDEGVERGECTAPLAGGGRSCVSPAKRSGAWQP